jgi:hypothetical protein
MRMLRISGEMGTEYLSDTLGATMDFRMVSPEAVEWAKKYAADEIKYITESQREAVRQIVVLGHTFVSETVSESGEIIRRQGITPKNQAKLIKDVVGLDPRRAQAVVNYRDGLIEQGMTYEEASSLAEKYAEKLLKQRAETIAVNEATTTSARGFHASTNDAVKRGILDPAKYVEYRIVTPDERLCPICAELEGEERELLDGVYPSSGSPIPKLHNLCRCVAGLKERNR